MDNSAYVPATLIKEFIIKVFTGLGVPEKDARICSDVLITADLRGIDSHGIARLKTIYYDRIRAGTQEPVTRLEVLRETPTTAVIDGHNGMGMVISAKAMETAMEKARNFGMGMVAVRNSTHYGIAGYYNLMAASRNMISMTGSNARPSVAPTFGVENMLGTNPFCIGMPTDEDFPFILDCATSTVQRGKIEVYARENKPLPPGWVVDCQGESVTDPNQVLRMLTEGTAALAPLGGLGEETAGYKGYGYATVVELLSAALQSGSCLKMLSGFDNGKKVPINLGHFFIAIDVGAFTEPSVFKKNAGDILRSLRSSRRMPGQDRIFTAGEKEHLSVIERSEKGIPLTEVTRKEMLVMNSELGLGFPLPF